MTQNQRCSVCQLWKDFVENFPTDTLVLDGAVAGRCKDIFASPRTTGPRKIIYIGHVLNNDCEVVRYFITGVSYDVERMPRLRRRYWKNLVQLTYVNARLVTKTCGRFWTTRISVKFRNVQITHHFNEEAALPEGATSDALEYAFIPDLTLHARDYGYGLYGIERAALLLPKIVEKSLKPLTADEEAFVLQQFFKLKPSWVNWLLLW